MTLETARALLTIGRFLCDVRGRHVRIDYHSAAYFCEIGCDDWLTNVMIKALVEWRVLTKKLYQETKDTLTRNSDCKEDQAFDFHHKKMLLQVGLAKLHKTQKGSTIRLPLTEEDVYLSGLMYWMRDWMKDWKARNPEATDMLKHCRFWHYWYGMFCGSCVDSALANGARCIERILSEKFGGSTLSYDLPPTFSDVSGMTWFGSWKKWMEEQDELVQQEKKRSRNRRKNKRNRLRRRGRRRLKLVEQENSRFQTEGSREE